jgi:hypothetical protein
MTQDKLTEKLGATASILEAMAEGGGPKLPTGIKAIREAAATLTEQANKIERLEGERDQAMRECLKWAQEAGEAKGRLEMSEAAGIVDGWRERAEAAETERDALKLELAEAVKQADDLAETLAHWRNRAGELEAECEGLREGLRPFAEYCHPYLNDFRVDGNYEPSNSAHPLADYRRARALIERKPMSKDEETVGLKACPLCGHDMSLVTWVANDSDSLEAMQAPLCVCGLQGPMYVERADAAAAWNTRTAALATHTYEDGRRDGLEDAAKVVEDSAKNWRNFAKMSLPVSPSPIINKDRAKVCDGLATAIRSLKGSSNEQG